MGACHPSQRTHRPQNAPRQAVGTDNLQRRQIGKVMGIFRFEQKCE